jgi:hypothetical protein
VIVSAISPCGGFAQCGINYIQVEALDDNKGYPNKHDSQISLPGLNHARAGAGNQRNKYPVVVLLKLGKGYGIWGEVNFLALPGGQESKNHGRSA